MGGFWPRVEKEAGGRAAGRGGGVAGGRGFGRLGFEFFAGVGAGVMGVLVVGTVSPVYLLLQRREDKNMGRSEEGAGELDDG